MHFTKVEDVHDIAALIADARQLKAAPLAHQNIGKDRNIGLIFLNPSLRTRLSTQRAAQNLGMRATVLNYDKEGWALEMEDGAIMNGTTVEHIKDAAAVMGQYFDMLAVRAFPKLQSMEEDSAETIIRQFIKYAGVPVISLESATRHPLQSLADMLTIDEHKPLAKKPKIVLSWAPHVKALPHAVANSFAEWTLAAGHELVITHPEGYELDTRFTKGATILHDHEEALENADFVYVKNWSSFKAYGQVHNTDESWMLTEKHLLDAPNAKVMHCLPVRRNVELSDEILDGDRSLVQMQAYNRIFAAQAVIKSLL